MAKHEGICGKFIKDAQLAQSMERIKSFGEKYQAQNTTLLPFFMVHNTLKLSIDMIALNFQ